MSESANERISESASQRIAQPTTHNPQPTTHNLVVLLALLVRGAWLLRFPTNPIAPVDAEGFHLLAVNMLAGRGFAIGWGPPFCPTAVRTPLYPLFVAGIYAIVGQDPVRVPPVQMLLEVLTTALVMRLGRDLGGKRVGLWAGVLYACNGTTQRYTGYLLSEALLLPLLTASVWMALRYLRRPTMKKAALAGFLWGLTLLTKPNVQFLALFVGGLLTWRMANRRIRESANRRIRESANRRIKESANRRNEKQILPSPTTHTPQLTPHNPHPTTHTPQLTPHNSHPTTHNSQPTTHNLKPKTQTTHYASRFTFYVSRFPALAFWLTLVVVLFPWLLRNRVVFGRWMLSTAFEENLARVSVVATLAEVEGARVEPWTETWEYYYDRFIADVGVRYGWDERASSSDGCVELQQRQIEIARAARDAVSAHPFSYFCAHLRGVLASVFDPGHRLWYHVLTGQDWESTGVVADIGARMAWSLERGAVGDALHALWTERIAHPPLLAALLWWGLSAARMALWVLGLRGAWRLRRRPWEMLALVGSVAYLLLLPGPIAHDRFYLAAIPVVVVLAACQVCSVLTNNCSRIS